MNIPTVEERLRRARGYAAVLTKLASEADPHHVPAKAFWRGLTAMAESLEEDIAAVQAAVPVTAQNANAPDVEVEF